MGEFGLISSSVGGLQKYRALRKSDTKLQLYFKKTYVLYTKKVFRN